MRQRFIKHFRTCWKTHSKFTEAGKIELGYGINDHNEVEFYVEDTGIGIAEENFSLIFDRFRKIEEKALQLRSGSGLGLAISKFYVEMMGGKIWIKSELGKGSTFYFTIPLDPLTKIKKRKG